MSSITRGQVILVDPGHGGKDCGAKAKIWINKKKLKYICEKDITLSISKFLHKELKKTYKKVYLTRTVDRETSLEERAEIADKIGADIFISIHINSSTKKSSHGVETFYLDNHKDLAVAKIEQVENKSLKGENKVINQILVDLIIDRTAPESKRLAKYIHPEINSRVIIPYSLKDRGIKPALFYVLALSKRPAVLLEAGFLSNSKERKKLLSRKFQMAYAKAIKKGIVKYFNSKKKKRKLPLF